MCVGRMCDFNRSLKTWQRVASVGREVYESRRFASCDEQAGPAYFGGMWLSRKLFWWRLRAAMSAIPPTDNAVCLDFGCGFGLVLPLLAERFDSVVGIDLVPELSREFLLRFTNRYTADARELLQVPIVESLHHVELAPKSVDLIVAFDVLEHIKSLDTIIGQFKSLLSPQGVVVVTGPTENLAYRFGRWMVGFSGKYHVADIYDVERALQTQFCVKRVRRIPRLIPLFEILVARNCIGTA